MGFLRGFSIAMGANAIVFVLSFLNNKLLYVYLSPEDNGSYFLVMRYALLIALVFGGWLRLTFINIAGQDKTTTPHLAANHLLYSISIGIILSGAVSILYLFMPTDTGIPAPFLMLTVIVTGVLLLIRNGFQSLLLVNNWMYHYGLTFILWGGVLLTLNAIFIIVLKMDLNAVFWVLMIASAFSAIWALGGVAVSGGFSFTPSLMLLKGSFVLGIRSALGVVGLYLMLYIHVMIMEPLIGDTGGSLATVGIFSVCFRIYELFQRGADVTATVLHAKVAQQKREDGFRTTVIVCRNLLAGMTVLALIATLFGKHIIYIIADSQYIASYHALLVMLPGIVLVTTGSAINSSYWARGYPYKIILAPFFGTIAGILMNMQLVPKFGIMGAAMTFSLVSTAWFLYIVVLFRIDSGYHISEILFTRWSDVEYVFHRVNPCIPWRQP